MGFGGISIWQLLIILAIIILLFGTKKLRNIGGDLGSAIKNFKRSMKDAQSEAETQDEDAKKLESTEGRVFDAQDIKDKDKHEA